MVISSTIAVQVIVGVIASFSFAILKALAQLLLRIIAFVSARILLLVGVDKLPEKTADGLKKRLAIRRHKSSGRTAKKKRKKR